MSNRSEYMRKWRQQNVDRVKATRRAYFKSNPHGVSHDNKMRQRKWRARQKEKSQDATVAERDKGKNNA